MNWLDGEGLARAADRISALERRLRKLVSNSALSAIPSYVYDKSTYGNDNNAEQFASIFLPRLQGLTENIQELPGQVGDAARGVNNMSKVALRTDEVNRLEAENLHGSIASNSYSSAGRVGDLNVGGASQVSPNTGGDSGGTGGGTGNSGGTDGRR
ncbi:hypothetical protein AB0M48_12175 [Lentzea sp. NPDC051208]|uniref:hypothetical protein n=1 Tax=Lentzea sp. NPDC051208 TaxID=3154642 RepID=UPI003417A90D